MEEKRLKLDLELHVVGDGRRFLNYWDYMYGNDVVAEIIDGNLVMEEGESTKKVTLNEFIQKIIDTKNE